MFWAWDCEPGCNIVRTFRLQQRPQMHLVPCQSALGRELPTGFAGPTKPCRWILHVPAAQTVNRRSFLVVSATTAAAAMGCQPAESPAAKTKVAARTDVPLRVVIAWFASHQRRDQDGLGRSLRAAA